MAYKLLRWIFGITALLIVILAIGLVGLYYYADNNRDQMIKDAVGAVGMDIAYQSISLEWWDDFPMVSIEVDSLTFTDSTASTLATPLLYLDKLRFDLSVDALLDDTLRLKRISLSDGQLFLQRDSSGRFNYGDLFEEKPVNKPEPEDADSYAPVLDWAGLEMDIKNLDFYHDDPEKKKLIEVYFHELKATGTKSTDGSTLLSAEVNAQVKGLALNIEKGTYLRDTPVKGPISALISQDSILVAPTDLVLGTQTFRMAAEIAKAGGTTIIHVSCDETDYALTRPLMHDELRDKLALYDVKGMFPVAATITLDPDQPKDPEIRILITLSGQSVRLKQYRFDQAYATASITNRLSEAEGGLANSKKNLRVELDSVSSYLGKILVETPHATVAIIPGWTKLTAPMHFSGPASSLGKQLKNRDFLFKKGSFDLKTNVDAPLDVMDDLISKSDGKLILRNVDVWYKPANATLPFDRIDVNKTGQDIRFNIDSKPLATDFAFRMYGKIDNLAPLLLERPGDALNSDVTLLTNRIDWTDFLSFFGDEGYFASEDTLVSAETAPQASMRKTLLGLKQTFHPKIEVRFDTMAYYDVFTVTDFKTGLHFTDDTLILEQTTFNWAGSQLDMDTKLDLNSSVTTPFDLSVNANHLNLNRLRPSLNYFGLKLPSELDSLPDDLSIRFWHHGQLHDTLGIVPGFNAGELFFDDGKNNLFTGQLNYSPGEEGLNSHFLLKGDPQIVNVLFDAENFFFGTGSFSLDADLNGTPKDLSELISTSKINLQIDSSRVLYLPADVAIPVRSFAVNMEEEITSFDLQFLTDSTNHSVRIDGTLDDLSAFLVPEDDRRFKVAAKLSAPVLQWSDFDDLAQVEVISADTSYTTASTLVAGENAPNIIPKEKPSLFSATKGVFSSFRPDLLVAVDTFLVKDKPAFTNIFAHLQLKDSLGLLLDNTGFSLGQGDIRLNARYALDELDHSPFSLDWTINELDFEELLANLEQMNISLPEDLSNFKGRLQMSGSLNSQLDESSQRLLLDSTQGQLTYELIGMEFSDSPFLMSIGRKAKMKKRFKQLRFAPLAGELVLENGLITIPRFEIQNTGVQLFIEGGYHLTNGPDLLVSLPLRNIGRGVLNDPPPLTGYAQSGWKVYLINKMNKDGRPKTKFRLGRRRYFKDRGQLDVFLLEKKRLRASRKKARQDRRRQE